jgi:hypothetical protein
MPDIRLWVIGDVDAEHAQLRFHNYMRSFSQSSENTYKNIFFIEIIRNFRQANESIYVMKNGSKIKILKLI